MNSEEKNNLSHKDGKTLLGVLVSGGGSNLQALIDACREDDYPAEIAVVISNNPQAYGLERAKKHGIPAYPIDHKNFDTKEEFENEISRVLDEYKVDMVCLAGFLRILTPNFISKRENRILNIHPSLLPAYGGKGMYGENVHKAVLENGEKITGVSVHIVTSECDKGPVILQKKTQISPDDTVKTLAAKVLEQEHIAYPQAVRKYIEENDFI